MRRSKTLRTLAAVVAVAMLAAAQATPAAEPQNQSRGVTNVVLVHGAWADGSSWAKVIPLLAAKGLHVDAVQLPLTSQAEDVAAVQRAIARVDGRLLLVAHSYGGAVITRAGNDPKVAGLVYVAAFAPAERESAADLTFANPTPFLAHLEADAFGFLKLSPTGIREDFAPDLSDSEQTVLAATQGPTSFASLSGTISTPAWRNQPSWFVIAAYDRVVSPTLQAMFAERMNATSITLPSSHVAMLSMPSVVGRSSAEPRATSSKVQERRRRSSASASGRRGWSVQRLRYTLEELTHMTRTTDVDAVLKAAEPLVHQHAPEIQAYGHTISMPIALSENVRKESVENLNQLLADTMTLRDLYKKHHWQVAGPTFYSLHLLFDKHYGEQNEIVDAIAERIQVLGGVSVAMAPDVADMTLIPRPPKGREEVPVQISRLLHAHEIVLREARTMARLAANSGDDGSNDLIVSDVIRRNELQVWFVAEHVVSVPLTHAK